MELRTKNGTRTKNQEWYQNEEPRTVPEPRTKNGTGTKNQEKYQSQELRTVKEFNG